jgi:hypothetical protein
MVFETEFYLRGMDAASFNGMKWNKRWNWTAKAENKYPGRLPLEFPAKMGFFANFCGTETSSYV